MQLKQALTSAIARFTGQKVPSPRLNAESLLMFTLKCDRAYLHAHPERELTADEATRYESALAERARGVPTQYVTGHQEFWSMDFIVTPAVLIPRPETEHVIEVVLELCKADLGPQTSGPKTSTENRTPDVRSPKSEVRVADIGTGSGCIAVALAKEFPDAEIHATDISSAALQIARANAARHQLENRIHFHRTDLLEGLIPQTFDLIVSNPPYVGESEEDQVQLEVRKFEPPNAVFAGPTGIEVIARLIPQAHTALKPAGWLIMEVSGTIAERVRELLREWANVHVTTDLQSIPRVIRAQKS
ncbi:MAG: peptide chain release factor N(5)-glutamine methyltransferase [Candidatus Sulfotelmatobacter sp.]